MLLLWEVVLYLWERVLENNSSDFCINFTSFTTKTFIQSTQKCLIYHQDTLRVISWNINTIIWNYVGQKMTSERKRGMVESLCGVPIKYCKCSGPILFTSNKWYINPTIKTIVTWYYKIIIEYLAKHHRPDAGCSRITLIFGLFPLRMGWYSDPRTSGCYLWRGFINHYHLNIRQLYCWVIMRGLSWWFWMIFPDLYF